jgi:hypothetical protein
MMSSCCRGRRHRSRLLLLLHTWLAFKVIDEMSKKM